MKLKYDFECKYYVDTWNWRIEDISQEEKEGTEVYEFEVPLSRKLMFELYLFDDETSKDEFNEILNNPDYWDDYAEQFRDYLYEKYYETAKIEYYESQEY